jgi:hypothetical protein
MGPYSPAECFVGRENPERCWQEIGALFMIAAGLFVLSGILVLATERSNRETCNAEK